MELGNSECDYEIPFATFVMDFRGPIQNSEHLLPKEVGQK